MSNFEEIEFLFSSFLAAASPVLSDTEYSEIQTFIDVGEYGLALETAADIYAEDKKIASPDAVALFERLADAMSITVKINLGINGVIGINGVRHD